MAGQNGSGGVCSRTKEKQKIPDRVTLKKEIGLLSACTIIIGNIIGSGIFISPKGVLEHSGSVGLALVVWVLGGCISALGSLCYAELGVTIPKSGGDYSYVTEIFGGLMGFLLLWSAFLIMYPTTLAVIALTFSNYILQPVFPNCVPPYMATRLLSGTCLLLLTWVNCSSVRMATRIQDIFTVGKLMALGLIIVVGLVQICNGNYEALTPQVAFSLDRTPSVGQIALAFLQASFAFSGWNFLNYVTEEVVEPRRRLVKSYLESFLSSCQSQWLCPPLEESTDTCSPLPVHCHYRYPVHRRNAQPHQLRVLHQLPVVRRYHRGSAVLPLEETQPVPPYQGEPAGTGVLPDVLGRAAGVQSVLRARGLWRRARHHAHRRTCVLPRGPLERQTKVHLHLHRDCDMRGPAAVLCGLSSS
ncbi:asc-type amino acid transporter 1 isoform X2 [Cololabis saira]|uniref:asc-type amino acid transporter 1 isoform X2 n=1 Tax=Cololabis saira TaxID=129043 RepID=UPI002AD27953|nr:asc-type amino acid transporter 1 isoform X2 [Cololabis saira]